MMKDEQKITPFSRNSRGSEKSTKLLLPPPFTRSRSRSTASRDDFEGSSCKSLPPSRSLAEWKPPHTRGQMMISTLVHRFLTIIKIKSLIFTPTGHGSTAMQSSSSGRIVSGTLFGQRRGHVSFAVHSDNINTNRNIIKPILLLELEISTAALVEDISTGTGRIVLECRKSDSSPSTTKLVCVQKWTIYCKGKKSGYARSRACTESDSHVLNTIRRVSVGAGVIPAAAAAEDRGGKGGGGGAGSELVYMRAKFERVVGSCDSEAFYMLNPDSNGGPEFSIFLLRK